MSLAKPPKDSVMPPPPQPKFCPILTAAIMRPQQESKIVGLDGQKQSEGGYDAVPCAGPNCAFFTPIHDGQGRLRGGNCAITLFPTAISMLNDSVRTLGVVADAAPAKEV